MKNKIIFITIFIIVIFVGAIILNYKLNTKFQTNIIQSGSSIETGNIISSNTKEIASETGTSIMTGSNNNINDCVEVNKNNNYISKKSEINNIVYNENMHRDYYLEGGVAESDYNIFPKPQKIAINYDGKGEMPNQGNSSKILFLSNNNTGNDYTFEDPYTLNGIIVNNVEKIEIIWDGDMSSYFLKTFKAGDKNFKYSISKKFNNINEGSNKYLIRGYTKSGTIERIFELIYTDKDAKGCFAFNKINEVKNQDTEYNYKYFTGGFYTEITENNINGYSILTKGIELGEYRLKMKNGYDLIYTVSYKKSQDYNYSFLQTVKISYIDKDGNKKYSNEIVINFTLPELGGGPLIKQYSDNQILITSSVGYESVPTYYYYNPEKNILYNIQDEIIEKKFGKTANSVYSVELQGKNIVLKEYTYCCDFTYNSQGNEIIIFNGDSLQLISKKLISPLKKNEWGKEFKQAVFQKGFGIKSADYGFTAIIGNKEYKIINPDLIDKTFKDGRDMNVVYAEGNIYKDEYIEITKIK